MNICMSLNHEDYHCDPEEADEMMMVESKNIFKNIFSQIRRGKTCHVVLKTMYLNSEYLVVNLEDSRDKYFYLPDDTDLHYPIQNIGDTENLEDEILKRAMKYREGVYVWLVQSHDVNK